MPELSPPLDSPAGSELSGAALRFARRVHLGQHRKQTHEQFVQHPIAVADLLLDAGCGGPMISAAYLHDVVEHTDVELAELRERFGPEVADLVDCLSENPEIDGYGARKRDLRRRILESGGDAVVIYAADRVANMRDWHKVPAAGRAAIGERLGTTLEERLELWTEDVEEMHEIDPETPFLDEMQSELTALRAESPTA